MHQQIGRKLSVLVLVDDNGEALQYRRPVPRQQVPAHPPHHFFPSIFFSFLLKESFLSFSLGRLTFSPTATCS